MSDIKPLGPLEAIALPWLKLTRKGSEAEKLNRRIEYTRLKRSRRKDQKKMIKALAKESKVFEKLIIDCYIRIGQAWMVGAAGVETGGKAPRKAKVQKVRFSRIFYTEELIYYEVQVNRRWLHTTRNMLPHHTLAATLVSDMALFELKHACRRLITVSYTDPRKGLWIIVHRLMGIDGIPLYVTYKEMLEHFPGSKIDDAPILVGAGENRKLVVFDLATRPHLLTGGSTRSGKSNFINGIICNYLRFARADDLKLILIDLKRMEFNYYAAAPHLMRPVIADPEEAIEVLDGLVKEILSRAVLMQGKAKELAEYNKRFPAHKLPRIICIVDEFAELVLQSEKEVGRAILKLTTRITNLGRAVGIHLILATQRPATEVVPNSIKINMPLIVAGRVQNVHQSVVILGTGDAARLPILPGRMVYSDGADLAQVQTPHILDADITEAVAIARGRHLGVIDLEEADPVIVPDGLICHLVDKLGGKLTADNLKHFKDLAVPMRALKIFIEEVVNKGSYTADKREFIVEKYLKSWKLVEITTIEKPAVTKTDLQRIIARVNAPPALLQLPAPREPEPIILPVDEPVEPAPRPATTYVHPLTMTDDEIVTLFIERCCKRGGRYKVTTRKFHDEYLAFCEQLDPNLVAMSIKKLTHIMINRGYKKHPNTGVNALTGITILSELSTSSTLSQTQADLGAA